MENKEELPEKFKNLKLGKPWTEVDSMKLKKMYVDEKKDIVQIAENLGRDKNKIINVLIELKLVKEEQDIRGIDNYKKSDYYNLVQEYYGWQKGEKTSKAKEDRKTIKKIANNEIFDKKDFKVMEEKINYLVEIVQELILSNKILKETIEKMSFKSETQPEISEKSEEWQTIKYKKKEYIIYNKKIYIKTENNKRGPIVGSYENEKVCMN